jgi:hypothetical protein
VENEDPEGTFYLNLFNLNNKITEEMVLEFYSDVPAESVLWNKSNYFSADVKFQTYERFKKAVLLGEPVFDNHKVCIRTSFQKIDKQQYLNRREEYFNRKKGGHPQRPSAGENRQWRQFNGYQRDQRKGDSGYQQQGYRSYNRRANDNQYYDGHQDYAANSYHQDPSTVKDQHSGYGAGRASHFQHSYPTHTEEGRTRKPRGLAQNRADVHYADEEPQRHAYDRTKYEEFPYDYSQQPPTHSKGAYSYVVDDYQSFKVDADKKAPQQTPYQYTYDYNNPQNQDWDDQNQGAQGWNKKSYEEYPSKSHAPYDATVHGQGYWSNLQSSSNPQHSSQHSYHKPKKTGRHEASGKRG